MNTPRKLSPAEILQRIEDIEAAMAEAEEGTSHIHLVDQIVSAMRPLKEHGMRATIVLTPIGYNHLTREGQKIRFKEGDSGLWVPRERLEQITVTHGGWFVYEGRREFYFWNGTRLLARTYTTELGSKRLGPFFKKGK